jgi:hypothetical protein
MRPWFERAVLISDASKVFDSDGHLIDAATQRRVRAFVEGFATFAGAQRNQEDTQLSIAAAPPPDIREGVMASDPRGRVATTLRMGEAQ